MTTWRSGVSGLLLAVGVGCGGEYAGEEPADVLAESPSGVEQESQALAGSCAPDEASTQRVKTILPPTQDPPRLALTPRSFVDFQGTLFFAADFEDGRNTALWKSDGSSAGTVAVTDMPGLDSLTAVSTRLFFQGYDATHGEELWVSDGSSAGTHFVKDVTPGADGSDLEHMTAAGSRLVFLHGAELWTSDGTTAGTTLVRAFPSGTDISNTDLKLGGALLFFTQSTTGTELWKTDGTAAGTVRLKRLDSGVAYPWDPRVSRGLGLFSLKDSAGNTELWKTDGTAVGTVRLNSYGPSRNMEVVGLLGSSVYVMTTSYSTGYMVLNRIPVAGGASTPVVTLPNYYAGNEDAFPFLADVSGVDGGRKLYFAVFVSSDGPAPLDTQLWVTDGTSSGTTLLRRPLSLSDEYGTPVYAVADDLVFFSAYEQTGAGIEPWVTNGTTAGTRRLKDVLPGASSSYPRDFLRVGTRVYFSAFDDTQAGQLWSTALRTTCVAPALAP